MVHNSDLKCVPGATQRPTHAYNTHMCPSPISSTTKQTNKQKMYTRIRTYSCTRRACIPRREPLIIWCACVCVCSSNVRFEGTSRSRCKKKRPHTRTFLVPCSVQNWARRKEAVAWGEKTKKRKKNCRTSVLCDVFMLVVLGSTRTATIDAQRTLVQRDVLLFFFGLRDYHHHYHNHHHYDRSGAWCSFLRFMKHTPSLCA